MNVPKQSIPVMRILPSVSYSNQVGVNPSMEVGDKFSNMFRRIFNRSNRPPGTCVCELDTSPDPNILALVNPIRNRCNSGFAPQCDENRKCRCKDPSQISNGGIIKIPT